MMPFLAEIIAAQSDTTLLEITGIAVSKANWNPPNI
jgi:hypothetical protein